MAVIRYFQRGASEELANNYRTLGAVGTEPSRFLLESKFYKIEKFFIERFLVVLSSIRRIELRHEIFSEIPRFVLEGMILCFPLVAFGFLNATDGGFDVATALPGLVVLVFGGLRGLPAAQAIYYTVLSFQNQNQNMVSILAALTEE